jgi:TP53 regulating kinase-like protein
VCVIGEMVYEKLEDLGFKSLKQGAEARLWSGTLFGLECVAKERFPKRYRHPELNETLTKDRLRSEARFIHRARAAGMT